MNRKKLLLIINPKAGTLRNTDIAEIARQHIDSTLFELEIIYTTHAGHATELSKLASQRGIDIVAAAGGDGTINETACGLTGSNIPLSIIPCGSGNGLARHLGVPMNLAKAFQHINSAKTSTIDYMSVNGHLSFNVSGIGFDADVAHDFAKMKGRGLKNYVKASITNYMKSKNREYIIDVNGNTLSRKAWMISFCNSNQFGNNAFIAPMADLNDGLMNVCILKKIELYKIPVLATRLFRGSLEKSPDTEYVECSSIHIKNTEQVAAHIDGEPVMLQGPVKIEMAGKMHVWV